MPRLKVVLSVVFVVLVAFFVARACVPKKTAGYPPPTQKVHKKAVPQKAAQPAPAVRTPRPAGAPCMAIILDDWGQNIDLLDEAIAIGRPLTLAVLDGMVVKVANETLVVPLTAIVETLKPKPQEVHQLGATSAVMSIRGSFIPMVDVARELGYRSDATDAMAGVALLVETEGGARSALLVDAIQDQRQVVIKSLEANYRKVPGISGATILGDGRICVILDVGALVRSEWRQRAPPESRAASQQDRRVFALVVDDSITVRRVTQRLLERNGMRVVTAKDGLEAVSVLQDEVPDVILLDIEMPRMDGYEVASHVRNDPRLKAVPIVMITSRVGEKHRARAIELGVNEYLGKPYQEGQLLQAIEPLVRRKAT